MRSLRVRWIRCVAETARRSVARITVALLLVILLGLGSRSGHEVIPVWLAENAGDALWTVAAYLGFALLFRGRSAGVLLVLALATSFAVELSQLIEAQWLEDLRSTTPGRLLLGQGWQWMDLPRYAAGAVLAYTLDRCGLFAPK